MSWRELVELYRLTDDQPALNVPARYNVAPTQQVPIVRLEDGRRRLAMVRWGLVPFWAKDLNVGYKMINARAETVAEKPSFRTAFRKRRCLVPASGFYEWKGPAGEKQPYYITLKGGPMTFAGLWESWRSAEGETIESCTIIVTDANTLCAPQGAPRALPCQGDDGLPCIEERWQCEKR
jgi:putative SOS response-associated peptidase YedK